MKKINYKLEGYELIKNIIELIRYYEKRYIGYGNKYFCYNQLRRFKYEKYTEALRHELSFFWHSIRVLRHLNNTLNKKVL
jgi:hypothetical protein